MTKIMMFLTEKRLDERLLCSIIMLRSNKDLRKDTQGIFVSIKKNIGVMLVVLVF